MGGRNQAIDFLKYISAIGVILVHVQFPGAMGRICASVGVCGVILYFLTSGFACAGDPEQSVGKLARRFRRNGRIVLATIAAYFAFTLAEKLILGGEALARWREQLASPVTWIRMVILGDMEFIHGDPLWFLVALLYGYLILLALLRLRLDGAIRYAVLPLLLLRIGMETYTNSFGADWHLSGNALVGALPVIFLGYEIGRNKDRVGSLDAARLDWLAAASSALMFISALVRPGGLDVSQLFKISTAALVFLLALKCPQAPLPRAVCSLGREDSLWIYLYHFPIIVLLQDVTAPMADSVPGYDVFLPIAVILFSLCLARLISSLLSRRRAAADRQSVAQHRCNFCKL